MVDGAQGREAKVENLKAEIRVIRGHPYLVLFSSEEKVRPQRGSQ